MTNEDEAQERRRLGRIPKALREASRGNSEALMARHCPTLFDRVPVSSLKDMARPGVYFLHLKGEVVYVGQSKNVRARVGSHFSDPAKEFDAVSFKPCEVARLEKLEALYIRHYAPRFNKCGLARSIQQSEVHFPSGLGQPSVDALYLSAEQAASFLNIATDDFLSLVASRTGPATRRVGRIGGMKAWVAQDLRDFAGRNRGLLASMAGPGPRE